MGQQGQIPDEVKKISDSTTVSIYISQTIHPRTGNDARKQPQATGVVIGRIQELHYVLAILSPCFIHWSDEISVEVSQKGENTRTPAWLSNFNPYTGLALLVFVKSSLANSVTTFGMIRNLRQTALYGYLQQPLTLHPAKSTSTSTRQR